MELLFVVLTATWIFFARVLDVSFGTLRLVAIVRDRPFAAWVLGFFEVLIWLAASAQVLATVFTDPYGVVYATAYAFGFATGNSVGLMIERKLAIGDRTIHILTRKGDDVREYLDDENYDATTFPCYTKTGPLEGMMLTVRRKHVEPILRKVRELDPDVVTLVEDVREVRKAGMQISPVNPLSTLVPRTGWRALVKKK